MAGHDHRNSSDSRLSLSPGTIRLTRAQDGEKTDLVIFAQLPGVRVSRDVPEKSCL